MIKLICIDDWNYRLERKHKTFTFGENYYASGVTKNVVGDYCYIIPGLPNSHTTCGKPNNLPIYRCFRFMEVSDLDEIKIHKKEKNV